LAEPVSGLTGSTEIGDETADEGCPDAYKCPVTKATTTDPVVASGGRAYEKAALERWFSLGSRRSPLTNVELSPTAFVPNVTLKKAVEEWRVAGRRNSAPGGGEVFGQRRRSSTGTWDEPPTPGESKLLVVLVVVCT
jgi:hypothetical protein